MWLGAIKEIKTMFRVKTLNWPIFKLYAGIYAAE
jgi:hypothetical protein